MNWNAANWTGSSFLALNWSSFTILRWWRRNRSTSLSSGNPFQHAKSSSLKASTSAEFTTSLRSSQAFPPYPEYTASLFPSMLAATFPAPSTSHSSTQSNTYVSTRPSIIMQTRISLLFQVANWRKIRWLYLGATLLRYRGRTMER